MDSFSEKLEETATRVLYYFDKWLVSDTPSRLVEATRYSALNGGKAFRAYLCLEAARLTRANETQAERVAVAIEAVHCYSLIHDDLPAMDNDDTRRGKPSLHIAYDEATAILAGNALFALAFEILSHPQTHNRAELRARLTSDLAQAVGAHGMLAGQMLDIESNAKDVSALVHLHSLKTGALIRYAVRAGAMLGNVDDTQLAALTDYANAIGLAYQITDDVFDSETDEANDTTASGNFATQLGVVEARHQARHLVETAQAALASYGAPAEGLRQAAAFVIERKN